jgi:TonB family protein
VGGLRSKVRLAVLASIGVMSLSGAAAAQQLAGHQREFDLWKISVTRHFFPFVSHPDLHLASCEAYREGFVVVDFSIDRSGRILDARVAKSSGIRAIDRTAAGIVKKGSPVPVPPSFVKGSVLKMRLPVAFKSRCHSAEP